MKKKKVWLNIIGLLFFVLAMPLFFRMGGGKIAMAEVLPGQAVTEGLSFSALFEKELGDTHCLLVRLHPQIHGSARIDGAVDVTDFKSINELTLISDMLITDYSSVCMDFVLLDKPCVFFAPDLDEYASRRPFYFSYREYVPGEVASDTPELIECIKKSAVCDKAEKFKFSNLNMVDGKSLERLFDKIFG